LPERVSHREPRDVALDYLAESLRPMFDAWRAQHGVEPVPPRSTPPVTFEEFKAAAAEYRAREALRKEQAKEELTALRRAQRATRVRPPDGLRSEAEAAAKLSISIRTLREHVASGSLRYVNIGRGKHRARRRFADADLDAFIATQTREDSPCPSIAPGARRTGTSISSGEVIGFTARRNARRAAKPKK
jgi:excisionase family DNA binding protein